MKRTLFFPLLLCSLCSFGQNESSSLNLYFKEDFETSKTSLPDGWANEYLKSPTSEGADWHFQTGGEVPPGAEVGLPATAHGGQYNAVFYKRSLKDSYQTYLTTKEIKLETATKPMLTFWYSQFQSRLSISTAPDNFEFTLYYKIIDADPEKQEWIKIKTYSDYCTELEPWKCDSVYLPDSAIGSSIRLAFLGNAKTLGLGTCIDDIKIEETKSAALKVSNIYASQPNQNIIPTSSIDNPILRLRIPVSGNSGSLPLKRLNITMSLEPDSSVIRQNNTEIKVDDVVASNGIKLYMTDKESFNTSYCIAKTSIKNGKATFENLNYELKSGNTYLWVTCDIKPDNEHRFKGYKVRMKIADNDITIGNSIYNINASGSRIIHESILFDDFENDGKWTFTGKFEHGIPNPNGDQYPNVGNPDPDTTSVHSGKKVIGTVLTGDGLFEQGLSSNAYTATSTTLDCYYYKDISLLFYRWLNKGFGDVATIGISTDNGETWKNIWENDIFIADKDWVFQSFNLSSMLDRRENVKIRFGLGPTGNSIGYQYTGWNIDDVALVGTYVYIDGAITEISTPNTDCQLTKEEPVTIKIKNVGYNDIVSPFIVSYKIDTNQWVSDTINDFLLRDQEMEYEFKTKADLSEFGYHKISAKIEVDDDEDSRNNSMQKKILSLPYIELPYSEKFEANNGYWEGYGNKSTWQWQQHGEKISSAYSGASCWSTNLSDSYQNGDSAWLESPCFNMTNVQKPILDFMLKGNAAISDGLAVSYSIDGNNWKRVPFETAYERFSWYSTDTIIKALNTKGWNGTFGWKHMQQLLPDEVAGQSSVKIRFVFASESDDSEGFAIDDIKLYESPVDAGVVEIVEPISQCYLSKEQPVTIRIKNFGNRNITSNDSLIASVKINDNITLTDTFIVTENIAPNASADFTFSQKADMWNNKTYNMEASTKIKGDTLLFNAIGDNTTNDTKVSSATILGEPTYSLGADVGTTDPEHYKLNGDPQSLFSKDPNVKYEWKDYSGNIAGTNKELNGLIPFPDGMMSYKYSIIATNSNGCQMTDTINIINSHTDIGISNVDNIYDNVEFCNSKIFSDIAVTVENKNEYEIEAGVKINIGYQIFDQDSNLFSNIEDTVLESNMAGNSSFKYQFKNQPSFLFDGEQNATFFTLLTPDAVHNTADIDHSNDSLKIMVNVWPLPIADINADDSILTTNPTSILLETKFIEGATYKWQNETEPTANTYQITSSKSDIYTVYVTDIHNCTTATDQVSVITDNWIIDSLLSPTNLCEPESGLEMEVRIINNSPNTYIEGFSIPTEIKFGKTVTHENIIFDRDIEPFDTIYYTFGTSFDMPAIGSYPISINIMPQHDINRDNNILHEYLSVWDAIIVNLNVEDTIYTKNATGIIIDAGSGFMNYMWDYVDGEQTFTINTNQSATYSVIVTDFNGCESDEKQVTIIATDYGIDEIRKPSASCELNESNVISFVLHNYSEDEIYTGDQIPIKVQLNDEKIENYKYTVLKKIASDESTIASFTYNHKFDSNKDYTLKMWIESELDKFNENDTATSSIRQYPHPDKFNLGNDIYTLSADTVVLIAPSGYNSCIWNDKFIGDTLKVTYKGSANYWAEVGNSYGCTNSDTIGIFTYDLDLDIISGAVNSCNSASDVEVWGRISVISQDVIPAGTNFTANYKLNDYEKEIGITAENEITAGKPLEFNFDKNIDLPEFGDYTIATDLTVNNLREAGPFNKKETTFRVGSYSIPFEDTVKTYEESIILDPGDKFKVFDWVNQQHFDEQALTANTSGIYILSATDIYGCKAIDSTYVHFIKPSYDITRLGFATSQCETNELTTISFYLKNTGNDIIAIGNQANISYEINNVPHDETYTFGQSLKPNDSLLVTFNSQADFSNVGTYSCMVKASIAGHEATLPFTFTTNEKPEVSLGDNISTLNSIETLTPGSSYSSYLWNNGANTPSISVTEDGDYQVTVTNSSGCSNSSSVHVHFVPATITITELLNPVSECGAITDEPVTINILNNGKKAITTSQKIGIKCIVDGDTLTSAVQLPMLFSTNATLSHTMNDVVTFNKAGTHNMSFYIDLDGIIQDSAKYTVEVYDIPEIEFESDSIIVDEYPYTLSTSNVLSSVGYLWSTGDVTSSIQVTENGRYTLTVTSDKNCQSSKYVGIAKKIIEPEEQEDTTKTIDPVVIQTALNDIAIYPNPTKDVLNINFNGQQTEGCQVLVANASGQIIFASKQTSDIMQLDVADWNNGVYFIKIADDKAFKILKFVKE